jgi:PAS domain S-box-containing protein
MNASIPAAASLRKVPPAAIILLGLLYGVLLSLVDRLTPPGISFKLFYLLGVVFVAWGAGYAPAVWVSLFSTVLIAAEDWSVLQETPHRPWFLAWNAATRFLLFWLAGWLTAEATRLTRHLGKLVDERTAQLRNETEQHKATAVYLAEALERFEQIADNINGVFWLRDLAANRIIYASPGAEKTWGVSREALYRDRQAWLSWLHPEDRQRVVRALTDHHNVEQNLEHRSLGRDGAVHWIRARTFPVHNAQGETYRVGGFAEDITARKQMQEALRESEERYRTLTEASPDAIFILDRQLSTTYVNSAGAALWRSSAADLIGRRQSDLFPPPAAQRYAQLVSAVFETGEAVRLEEPLPCAEGERWLEQRLVPIRGNGSATTSILAIARDVTDQRRAQSLLRVQRDVGVSLSTSGSLETALKSLLGIVVRLEGVDGGGVYLANPRNGGLDAAAFDGRVSDEFKRHVAHFSASDHRTQVIKLGQPLYERYDQIAGWRDSVRDREGLKALALLPFCHEGVVVGSLHLGSHTQDTIPMQTRVVLEAVAAQAAGAIARIRAEEALLESQARLRAIITGVPVLFFAVDQHGVIRFEDGQALRRLGAEPGVRVGRAVTEVYADVPIILDNVTRALRGETFSSVVDANGVTLDCCYSPTRDKEGRLSGYIGVGIDISERYRLERQIVELSDHEQARIGQEIHDGLCQQLVGLAFDANALVRDLSAVARPEAAAALRMASHLDEAITEARRLARGLFPLPLETEGLPGALELLARTTADRFHIQCRCDSTAPMILRNSAMATHLYRIAQEAVNNALKHAGARTISIQLLPQDDGLELRVEDDGIGLRAGHERQSPGGMGLQIMDYRARRIGGALRVTPRASGGTVLSCCVPHATR